MSETNGKTDATPLVAVTDEPEPYKPNASTEKVFEAVLDAIGSVVSVAARQADNFVMLASYYDKDRGIAVRYGHLVDAAECLEIAQVHLDRIKAEMAFRLKTEDDRNLGPTPGSFQF
jgi:hypothetical protein